MSEARVAKRVYWLENKRLRGLLMTWDPPIVADILREEIKELKSRVCWEAHERQMASEARSTMQLLVNEMKHHRAWAEKKKPAGLLGRIQKYLFGEPYFVDDSGV